RAPKCFIHGFPSGGRAWSFSFIASATKSRSVCPCRAATALASRKTVSGRSTVVFILSHIYSFTAKDSIRSKYQHWVSFRSKLKLTHYQRFRGGLHLTQGLAPK